MSDELANVAAAEAAVAPEPIVNEAPQAVEAKTVEVAKPDVAKSEPNPRGAIERAMAKLNDRGKAAEGDSNRDPATGRFQAKDLATETTTQQQPQPKATEQQPKPQTASVASGELPARLKNDPAVAAEWANAPEAVRGAVNRTIRELEGGLQQYREAATAFNDLREFDQLARQSGTTMKQAMTNYVNLDRLIQQDPIEGLKAVANSVGLNILDIAHQIVGMNPGYEAKQAGDPALQELKRENADLRRRLDGLDNTFQETRRETMSASINEQVAAFRSAHPRFDELEAEMAQLISDKNMSLDEAYDYAAYRNPVPPAPTVQVTARPQTPSNAVPQTHNGDARKGTLTVTGSPGNGSNPSARIPSTSIRESLERARSAVG